MKHNAANQEDSIVKKQFGRRQFLQATGAALATGAVAGKSAAASPDKSSSEGVEPWSDPETWDGSTPSAGDEVTIGSDKHILLDQSTPDLGGVTVHGVLEFKDGGYRELTADYLLAESNGLIQIGTDDDPFESKAVITLTGSETGESIRGEDDMAIGTNLFGTFDGGTINIHGSSREKTDWTQLSATASAGDTQIKLAKSVNWEEGDEIVIAPSGTDPKEAERRTVKSVVGDSVELNAALDYDHFGEVQNAGGQEIDMRAEVGLLTRNIVMRGANEVSNPGSGNSYSNPTKGSTSLEYESGFGAHGIFAKDPNAVQIEGLEVYHAGQTGHQARYPLHFHHANEQSDSYIAHNSVHDSYQRGYNSHGTGSVTYKRNVGYDINGHGFLVEEGLGAEQNNEFVENLVVFNRRVPQEDRPFGGVASATGDTNEQNDFRPGAFWISNPNNILKGNHAAGGHLANGFFYDGRGGFEVDSDDIDITFKNNTAHTYSTEGKLRYKNLARGFGVLFQMFPDVLEQFPDDLIAPEHSIEELTAYNNGHSAVWTEWRHTTLENSAIADFRVGHFALGGSTTRNNLFLSDSDNHVGRGGGDGSFFTFTSDSGGSDDAGEYDDAIQELLEQGQDGIRKPEDTAEAELYTTDTETSDQNNKTDYTQTTEAGANSTGLYTTSEYLDDSSRTAVFNDTIYYRQRPSNEGNNYENVDLPKTYQRTRILEL
ncbi:G8 domain-containing protein [Haloarcula amylolytica]|uniref:G8 domain-containing protein n=1 Tax=Haloarcula amylolytica TaxID=396317 RepID=UPI001955356C|nr:G8 domain-containing protein [Haloarcula amylolytica]